MAINKEQNWQTILLPEKGKTLAAELIKWSNSGTNELIQKLNYNLGKKPFKCKARELCF